PGRQRGESDSVDRPLSAGPVHGGRTNVARQPRFDFRAPFRVVASAARCRVGGVIPYLRRRRYSVVRPKPRRLATSSIWEQRRNSCTMASYSSSRMVDGALGGSPGSAKSALGCTPLPVLGRAAPATLASRSLP